MSYGIRDKYYNKIAQKVEDGIFTRGKNCKLQRYSYNKDIWEFPKKERTPEVCVSLIDYSKCRFSDVPEFSRTREFFINAFSDKDVNNYIKSHISDFDRQFFKDLIETNEYATHFDTNCFNVMPLEYIDEEMCSLAILGSTNWGCNDWFYSVYRRKPEALTSDLWKLGARFYSRLSGKLNEFLSITPEEYRDTEYYKEMCRCNFNCGMELDTNKGKIMESIPQEVLTTEFLISLLAADINNIARFSEKALETEIIYNVGEDVVCEKIWQSAIRFNGDTIKYMKLNDERIEYFLSYYGKDSSEYKWSFKDKYHAYMKEKNEAEAFAQTQQRTQRNALDIATGVLMDAFACAMGGVDPTKAIAAETDRNELMNSSYIPIKYEGIIPSEFSKECDSEEYLKMLYETIGIKIIEEYDDLFYRVSLPEGWSIENDYYWNNIKDNEGNIIIKYFYDSKFYDREAYVREVNISKEKIDEGVAKKLVISDRKRITE